MASGSPTSRRAQRRQLVDCTTCDTYGNVSMAADGSQVAYAIDGQVWLVDVASGARRQVTQLAPARVAVSPTLSPDGRRIAFVVEGEPGLWAIGIDGSDLVQLSDDEAPSDPAWSPDGRSIAYGHFAASEGPGAGLTYQLWRLDVATGARSLVWQNPGCCMNGGIAGWSPDSTRLAAVAHPGSTLWVVQADGSSSTAIASLEKAARPAWRPVPLASAPTPSVAQSVQPSAEAPVGSGPAATTSEVAGCDAVSMASSASEPSPSPAPSFAGLGDGSIAFVPAVDPPPDHPVLWLARGSAAVPVTAFPPPGTQLRLSPVAVLPGGSRTLVTVDLTSTADPLSDCSDLWVVAADGSEASRVTHSAGAQTTRDAHLSPDGQMVAYLLDDASGDGSTTTLHITTLAGVDRSMGAAPCSGNPSGLRFTAWSRDGSRLAFSCGAAIVTVDVLNGQRRTLTFPAAVQDINALAWDDAGGAGTDLLVAYPDTDRDSLVMDRVDAVSGAISEVGSWRTIDGKRIEWVDGFPPEAFSPDRGSLLALGGTPGVLPGADFEDARYRIDLGTSAISQVLGPEQGPDQASWTDGGEILSQLYTDTGERLVAIDPHSGASRTLADLPSSEVVVRIP